MRQRLTFLLLLFICISCAKIEDTIGDFPVYLELDLTFKDKELRTAPSSKTYSLKDLSSARGERCGYGGVLVVHSIDDGFYAFDLACPYEHNRGILVSVDENTLNAVCPKCGTKYDISMGGTGAPNGVGKYYLKKYSVFEKGSTLVVTN
jgi:nitrite reductase/ring-hydroxylating ferredoxin subunit